MPMYEFHCDQCEEEFEEILSIQDGLDEVVCPACGSHDIHKLLSGFTMSTSGVSSGAGASSCSSSGPFR